MHVGGPTKYGVAIHPHERREYNQTPVLTGLYAPHVRYTVWGVTLVVCGMASLMVYPGLQMGANGASRTLSSIHLQYRIDYGLFANSDTCFIHGNPGNCTETFPRVSVAGPSTNGTACLWTALWLLVAYYSFRYMQFNAQGNLRDWLRPADPKDRFKFASSQFEIFVERIYTLVYTIVETLSLIPLTFIIGYNTVTGLLYMMLAIHLNRHTIALSMDSFIIRNQLYDVPAKASWDSPVTGVKKYQGVDAYIRTLTDYGINVIFWCVFLLSATNTTFPRSSRGALQSATYATATLGLMQNPGLWSRVIDPYFIRKIIPDPIKQKATNILLLELIFQLQILLCIGMTAEVLLWNSPEFVA